MEHARLISIAQKVVHKFGKDRHLPLCCAVYSRARSITLRPGKSARSIRGRGVIKEIRYWQNNAPTVKTTLYFQAAASQLSRLKDSTL